MRRQRHHVEGDAERPEVRARVLPLAEEAFRREVLGRADAAGGALAVGDVGLLVVRRRSEALGGELDRVAEVADAHVAVAAEQQVVRFDVPDGQCQARGRSNPSRAQAA